MRTQLRPANLLSQPIGVRPGATPKEVAPLVPARHDPASGVSRLVDRIGDLAKKMLGGESAHNESVAQRSLGFDVSEPSAPLDLSGPMTQSTVFTWMQAMQERDPGVKLLMQLASDPSILRGSRVRSDEDRVFQLTHDIGIGPNGFVHISRSDGKNSRQDPESFTYEIAFSPLREDQLGNPPVIKERLDEQLTRALQEVKAYKEGNTAYVGYRLLTQGSVKNPPSPLRSKIENEPEVSQLGQKPSMQRLSLAQQVEASTKKLESGQLELGQWLNGLASDDPGVKLLMKLAGDAKMLNGSRVKPEQSRVFQLTHDVGIGVDGFVRISRGEGKQSKTDPESFTYDIKFSAVTPEQFETPDWSRSKLEEQLSRALQEVRAFAQGDQAHLSWRLLAEGAVKDPTGPLEFGRKDLLSPSELQGTAAQQRAWLAQEFARLSPDS